ncbi:MAG: hypothetical protein QNK37_23550 [Acidobacteriota bacterium]|nr:hypothetical protein [Acidobacteriota bacterium]
MLLGEMMPHVFEMGASHLFGEGAFLGGYVKEFPKPFTFGTVFCGFGLKSGRLSPDIL